MISSSEGLGKNNESLQITFISSTTAYGRQFDCQGNKQMKCQFGKLPNLPGGSSVGIKSPSFLPLCLSLPLILLVYPAPLSSALPVGKLFNSVSTVSKSIPTHYGIRYGKTTSFIDGSNPRRTGRVAACRRQ